MRIPLLAAGALLVLDAATPKSYEVKWVGELHKVMNGEDQAAVQLDSLSKLPNLYAIGPLAGLNGEVTILNSDPSVAVIRDGKPVTERTFHADLPLIIYAQVAKWNQTPIPASVHSLADLEKFVAARAKKSSVDMSAPFPFRVTAHCDSAAMHIVNRQGRDAKGHEGHEAIQVKVPVSDADLEFIGFWSDKHEGILTHMGSNSHVHGRTADGKLSGHVDGLRLRTGTLFLPAN